MSMLEWFFVGATVVAVTLLAILIYILIQILTSLRKINRKLLVVLELLRKIVKTVPSVTLGLSPSSVDHGDTVTASGVANTDTDTPAVGASVALSMTDSAGTTTDLGTVTTDDKGAYTLDIVVQTSVAPGDVVVTATFLSATAQATFTRSNKKMV